MCWCAHRWVIIIIAAGAFFRAPNSYRHEESRRRTPQCSCIIVNLSITLHPSPYLEFHLAHTTHFVGVLCFLTCRHIKVDQTHIKTRPTTETGFCFSHVLIGITGIKVRIIFFEFCRWVRDDRSIFSQLNTLESGTGSHLFMQETSETPPPRTVT